MRSSTSTWILSIKVLFLSIGVVSLAVGIKFLVPSIPTVWSVILSWLKPPYLYVVMNGIIITIAAASRFHHHSAAEVPDHTPQSISVKMPPPQDMSAAHVAYVADVPLEAVYESVEEQPAVKAVVYESMEERPAVIYESVENVPVVEAVVYESGDRVVELNPVTVNGEEVHTENGDDVEAETGAGAGDNGGFVGGSSSMYTWPQKIISTDVKSEFVFPVREKPLVSSRFGPRKPTKANYEGTRALRVARPKRQETLESTWKAITEGRHVPLTRHLKKSDTWEHHMRHGVASPSDHVLKSETFRDRTNYNDSPPTAPLSSLPSLKIRKEPSLGQDELNRRVEAFIKKFNEEMRLQRQESLNQYMEMINRGV